MSKSGPYLRICSTQAIPAMPLPTTTRRSRLDMDLSPRTATIGVSGPFDAHGRLLVVRLARERVEGALRHLVGVRLGVVERHEHMSGRDGLGDPHFDAADASAPRH